MTRISEAKAVTERALDELRHFHSTPNEQRNDVLDVIASKLKKATLLVLEERGMARKSRWQVTRIS